MEPSEASIRLKLGIRGSSSIKMILVQPSATFRELRAAAALKLGFQTPEQLDIFWDDADCKVDEGDEVVIGTLFRDGDRIMVAQGPAAALGEHIPKLMHVEPMRRPSPSLQAPSHAWGGNSSRGEEEEMSSDGMEGRQLVSGVSSGDAPFQRPLQHSAAINGLLGSIEDQMDGLGRSSCNIPTSVKLPADGSKKCTCRKNKCLKLYCQCFASNTYCSGCVCQDCSNTLDNSCLVSLEMQRTLLRNPQAFVAKVGQKDAGSSAEHKNGCRCRKSRCIKKYCECFDGAVRCSPQCRCTDCMNQPEPLGPPGSWDGDQGLAVVAPFDDTHSTEPQHCKRGRAQTQQQQQQAQEYPPQQAQAHESKPLQQPQPSRDHSFDILKNFLPAGASLLRPHQQPQPPPQQQQQQQQPSLESSLEMLHGRHQQPLKSQSQLQQQLHYHSQLLPLLQPPSLSDSSSDFVSGRHHQRQQPLLTSEPSAGLLEGKSSDRLQAKAALLARLAPALSADHLGFEHEGCVTNDMPAAAGDRHDDPFWKLVSLPTFGAGVAHDMTAAADHRDYEHEGRVSNDKPPTGDRHAKGEAHEPPLALEPSADDFFATGATAASDQRDATTGHRAQGLLSEDPSAEVTDAQRRKQDAESMWREYQGLQRQEPQQQLQRTRSSSTPTAPEAPTHSTHPQHPPTAPTHPHPRQQHTHSIPPTAAPTSKAAEAHPHPQQQEQPTDLVESLWHEHSTEALQPGALQQGAQHQQEHHGQLREPPPSPQQQQQCAELAETLRWEHQKEQQQGQRQQHQQAKMMEQLLWQQPPQLQGLLRQLPPPQHGLIWQDHQQQQQEQHQQGSLRQGPLQQAALFDAGHDVRQGALQQLQQQQIRVFDRDAVTQGALQGALQQQQQIRVFDRDAVTQGALQGALHQQQQIRVFDREAVTQKALQQKATPLQQQHVQHVQQQTSVFDSDAVTGESPYQQQEHADLFDAVADIKLVPPMWGGGGLYHSVNALLTSGGLAAAAASQASFLPNPADLASTAGAGLLLQQQASRHQLQNLQQQLEQQLHGMLQAGQQLQRDQTVVQRPVVSLPCDSDGIVPCGNSSNAVNGYVQVSLKTKDGSIIHVHLPSDLSQASGSQACAALQSESSGQAASSGGQSLSQNELKRRTDSTHTLHTHTHTLQSASMGSMLLAPTRSSGNMNGAKRGPNQMPPFHV